MSRYWSKSLCYKWVWVTFSANVRGKGASPTNDFWHQKTRVPGLSYGEKNAENFNQLSRAHQRHRVKQTTGIRQTDRQTDRQTELTWYELTWVQLDQTPQHLAYQHVWGKRLAHVCQLRLIYCMVIGITVDPHE